MKIGDYIRTKMGISQCITVIPIRENSFMYEFDKEVYEEVNYLTASELKKYKSSPNIIDLIKVGDYVNGYKITDFTEIGKYNDEKILYADLKVNLSSEYITIHENEIKTIVTKEQFESMEYRIGK